MEQRYWELRSEYENALENWRDEPTEENLRTRSLYQDLCMDILERFMDENSNVLTRLKEW